LHHRQRQADDHHPGPEVLHRRQGELVLAAMHSGGRYRDRWALDAYSIVDATARYRYRPWNLTFRLTAKNLLHADYILARRPNGIFPGGFRQVILGIRWEWEGQARQGN
jgi:hypothetical protein